MKDIYYLLEEFKILHLVSKFCSHFMAILISVFLIVLIIKIKSKNNNFFQSFRSIFFKEGLIGTFVGSLVGIINIDMSKIFL